MALVTDRANPSNMYKITTTHKSTKQQTIDLRESTSALDYAQRRYPRMDIANHEPEVDPVRLESSDSEYSILIELAAHASERCLNPL